ncbi:hypothetical protein BPUTEOMOX_889 [methanotrophic endosymbiont of Bathymodiolus puteoserpentis (Logatchev)]|nr:hypothetical protein BPUTEOMOX_889 [methanotrophic endosymbiont of Bathymodiolus puteoserpentis (Logatchev)]
MHQMRLRGLQEDIRPHILVVRTVGWVGGIIPPKMELLLHMMAQIR